MDQPPVTPSRMTTPSGNVVQPSGKRKSESWETVLHRLRPHLLESVADLNLPDLPHLISNSLRPEYGFPLHLLDIYGTAADCQQIQNAQLGRLIVKLIEIVSS